MTADEILAKILNNGRVDSREVMELEKIVKEDWVVDQNEVQLLFQVNKSIGGNDEDCPEWTQFFVATVTRLLVADMATPGTIDSKEGDWLGELFEQYSVGNHTEKKLIHEIQNTTTSISGKIGEIIKPYSR